MRKVLLALVMLLVATGCSDDEPTAATTATTTTVSTSPPTSAGLQPFAVSTVDAPRITNGGAKANLTVTFKGTATYPITMITTPRTCPQGGCLTQDSQHASGNPLVRTDALWCAGYPAGTDVTFDYRVVLIDAVGSTTTAFDFSWVCDATPSRRP